MEGVPWAMCKSAKVVNNTQHHEIFITATYKSEHVEFFPLPAGEKIKIERIIPMPGIDCKGVDGISYIHVRCDGLDDEISHDFEVLWSEELHKYNRYNTEIDIVVNKENNLKLIMEIN